MSENGYIHIKDLDNGDLMVCRPLSNIPGKFTCTCIGYLVLKGREYTPLDPWAQQPMGVATREGDWRYEWPQNDDNVKLVKVFEQSRKDEKGMIMHLYRKTERFFPSSDVLSKDIWERQKVGDKK